MIPIAETYWRANQELEYHTFISVNFSFIFPLSNTADGQELILPSDYQPSPLPRHWSGGEVKALGTPHLGQKYPRSQASCLFELASLVGSFLIKHSLPSLGSHHSWVFHPADASPQQVTCIWKTDILSAVCCFRTLTNMEQSQTEYKRALLNLTFSA